MSCVDFVDAADVPSGISDPIDDPTPSEILMSDGVYIEEGVSRVIQFDISVSPINFVDGVQVTLSTRNGTAIAGTHYTARTGSVVTIPAGEGNSTQQINVLNPAGVFGSKTFYVDLTAAVNATITDASNTNVIPFGDPPPPPDPGGDPTKIPAHIAWPDAKAVVYDQTIACDIRGSCTGHAGAAATSCHAYRDNGQRERYNARKLFIDSGGQLCDSCASGTCHGFNVTQVLQHCKTTGAQNMANNGFRKMKSWNELSAANKPALIDKIKTVVYTYGLVLMDCIWYDNWNTAGSHGPHNILPDNGNATNSTGHSLLIIGWNDNVAGTGKGCFRLQSSHGTGWGHGGRAWIPYSYLRMPSWVSPNPRYRYFRAIKT